ncbi:glycolate dehydrogenase, FAD-binding subunit GlcE [Geomicrobium sp. JCM 19037]|uniref:FAD-binding oxidoreductase n=1 Tax=Geomicrobium sp. JCM 19037 TaxID=1460634 RepID=UPI00045F12BE|nr:FAD-binding oxidoreductase [Geomicrobium sp. JCM 19037]GAK04918.1 glycolate dehydrogenase, FAD-binding subunit GlcE [Geomicrobium sp. JCM 19037]
MKGNKGKKRYEPLSEEEVVHLLQEAQTKKQTVIPTGNGSKRGFGGVTEDADIELSLKNMNRILEHSAGDMTVTVQPGANFQDVQDQLAEYKQMIPIDPYRPADATIGGVIASNDSGPKRALYGSARDHVIGLRVAHPSGEVLRSGGKVVKNVAGYDMNKLFIGSMGTLGVMTECTFKLRPIPKFTALCVVTFSDPDALRPFLVELLNSYMEPVTLEVVNLRDVLITFEDVEEAVHAQIEWVNTHVPNSATVDTRTGTDVHTYWRSFNDLSFTHNDPIILKVGTKNMHVLDVLRNCKRLTDVDVYAHGGVAHGLSRIYLSGDTATSSGRSKTCVPMLSKLGAMRRSSMHRWTFAKRSPHGESPLLYETARRYQTST